MLDAPVQAGLLGESRTPDYNADERLYSVHVRDELLKLLRGDRGDLDLMVKYYREPERLSSIRPPASVKAGRLRLPQVEEMISSSIRFLYDGASGGPVAQREDAARGVVVQQQDFTTSFPHIVIQRTDTFDVRDGSPIESKWCAYRVQNSRAQLRIGRVLDIANLGLELIRLGR